MPKKTQVVEEVVEPVEETVEEEEEETLITKVDGIIESIEQFMEIFKQLKKETKDLRSRLTKREKEISKLEKKGKKVKGTRVVNQNPVPILTKKFEEFIENNYEELKHQNGKSIIDEIVRNDDDQIMLTRQNCMQLVYSYIRKNIEKDEDNKKRVIMDDTLSTLFPQFAEGQKVNIISKDDDGNKVEETITAGSGGYMVYTDILGGISTHLDETKAKAFNESSKKPAKKVKAKK